MKSKTSKATHSESLLKAIKAASKLKCKLGFKACAGPDLNKHGKFRCYECSIEASR